MATESIHSTPDTETSASRRMVFWAVLGLSVACTAAIVPLHAKLISTEARLAFVESGGDLVLAQSARTDRRLAGLTDRVNVASTVIGQLQSRTAKRPVKDNWLTSVLAWWTLAAAQQREKAAAEESRQSDDLACSLRDHETMIDPEARSCSATGSYQP